MRGTTPVIVVPQSGAAGTPAVSSLACTRIATDQIGLPGFAVQPPATQFVTHPFWFGQTSGAYGRHQRFCYRCLTGLCAPVVTLPPTQPSIVSVTTGHAEGALLTIPSVTLAAGEVLVVYASGKNNTTEARVTSVDWGTEAMTVAKQSGSFVIGGGQRGSLSVHALEAFTPGTQTLTFNTPSTFQGTYGVAIIIKDAKRTGIVDAAVQDSVISPATAQRHTVTATHDLQNELLLCGHFFNNEDSPYVFDFTQQWDLGVLPFPNPGIAGQSKNAPTAGSTVMGINTTGFVNSISIAVSIKGREADFEQFIAMRDRVGTFVDGENLLVTESGAGGGGQIDTLIDVRGANLGGADQKAADCDNCGAIEAVGANPFLIFPSNWTDTPDSRLYSLEILATETAGPAGAIVNGTVLGGISGAQGDFVAWADGPPPTVHVTNIVLGPGRVPFLPGEGLIVSGFELASTVLKTATPGLANPYNPTLL